MKTLWLVVMLWLSGSLISSVQAWEPAGPYPFGVLNHRSLALTAEYWNPILRYVGEVAGVTLVLTIARTANETTDLAGRGELALVYTNHLFTPERAKWGYTVLARQAGEGIRGAIVVAANAPAQRLQDLEGTRVAFANPYGFTGYSVPLDALLKAGVKVKPVFAGNQEAAMGQLKHGTVQAAGVNSQVMANFAAREKFAYRVLYSSESYYDLCVMAHPDVPEAGRERVRTALTQMAQTPAGWAILLAGAEKIGAAKPKGFVRADEQDYDNYRKFYAQAEPVEQTEPVLEAQ